MQWRWIFPLHTSSVVCIVQLTHLYTKNEVNLLYVQAQIYQMLLWAKLSLMVSGVLRWNCWLTNISAIVSQISVKLTHVDVTPTSCLFPSNCRLFRRLSVSSTQVHWQLIDLEEVIGTLFLVNGMLKKLWLEGKRVRVKFSAAVPSPEPF